MRHHADPSGPEFVMQAGRSLAEPVMDRIFDTGAGLLWGVLTIVGVLVVLKIVAGIVFELRGGRRRPSRRRCRRSILRRSARLAEGLETGAVPGSRPAPAEVARFLALREGLAAHPRPARLKRTPLVEAYDAVRRLERTRDGSTTGADARREVDAPLLETLDEISDSLARAGVPDGDRS